MVRDHLFEPHMFLVTNKPHYCRKQDCLCGRQYSITSQGAANLPCSDVPTLNTELRICCAVVWPALQIHGTPDSWPQKCGMFTNFPKAEITLMRRVPAFREFILGKIEHHPDALFRQFCAHANKQKGSRPRPRLIPCHKIGRQHVSRMISPT